MHGSPLLSQGTLDANNSTERAPVGSCADEAHSQRIISIGSFICVEHRGPIVCADENVEVSVMIKIGVGGPTRDNWPLEIRTDFVAHILKMAVPLIAEK